MPKKLVLITGCSGGGKTTLLNMLRDQGFHTISEPGRRIVVEEQCNSGEALPWINLKAFSHRAVQMATHDLASVQNCNDLVFFDRGLIDAALALQYSGGKSYRETLGNQNHYFNKVFLAPPWPDIFKQDDERKHGFKSAVEEFDRIHAALRDLNYDVYFLPKTSITDRIEFILAKLGKV